MYSIGRSEKREAEAFPGKGLTESLLKTFILFPCYIFLRTVASEWGKNLEKRLATSIEPLLAMKRRWTFILAR